MQKQENHSQAAILGLQHLLAMYSGSILVPIMIAGALGYNAQQLTYLISTDIFMCGVATFLQLQLNKYFGIGLPVVLGVSKSPFILAATPFRSLASATEASAKSLATGEKESYPKQNCSSR